MRRRITQGRRGVRQSTDVGEQRRSLRLRGVDPDATLRPLMTGPTARRRGRECARAARTPTGPGTIHFGWTTDGTVTAAAWGPGAEWLLTAAPRWLGLHDDLDGFDASRHPLVSRLAHAHRGLRLGASGLIWQEVGPTIVAQRITSGEAARQWSALVWAFGEPAPGPRRGLGLRLPPAPDAIAGLTYHALHGFDVERRRADALLQAARHAARLEEAATMPIEDALRRLSALPGLGAWTATSVASVAHGHADVVVLRDYGIPSIVTWTLAGERVGDDDRMLELLEPFAGHRWRVVRLLMLAGTRPPRHGPRHRVIPIRDR
jgi:3-methyladenine DNA glycosylase/8-oxoguanine DNA glycosylase